MALILPLVLMYITFFKRIVKIFSCFDELTLCGYGVSFAVS